MIVIINSKSFFFDVDKYQLNRCLFYVYQLWVIETNPFINILIKLNIEIVRKLMALKIKYINSNGFITT